MHERLTLSESVDSASTAAILSTRTGSASAKIVSEGLALCPVFESSALLQGGKRMHISHNGSTYQLQATRQGKLILTK